MKITAKVLAQLTVWEFDALRQYHNANMYKCTKEHKLVSSYGFDGATSF